MTVYIFAANKQLRQMTPTDSVTDLIHDEANYTISATISMEMGITTGEYIGFRCVDGHFRMFAVTKAENFDDRAVTIITGTDAIVQELKETVIEDKQLLDVGLKDAILGLMEAAGQAGKWTVTGQEPDRTEKSRAYYSTAWAMLETYMTLYEWRIIPYYVFSSSQITGRVISLEKDEATFRGRILRSKKDASNVYVIRSEAPITRLYGLGKATGTEEEPSNLTFAEVTWSTANGDPADKPKGQTWVEDAQAVSKYGVRTAVIVFNQVEDETELMQKTWEELQKRKESTCTVEATIQDTEQVPGYEHQIIRLGDLVPIRLVNASMEAARVIGIKRDYIRHWLTKLVIGQKTSTIQTQVSTLIASATHTFERLTIHKNRFQEDEALIQLNAEMVQANANVIELNAQEIRANAELIALKAGKEEVTELGNVVSAAMIRLDGAEAEIQLKASRQELTELSGRLSNAEIRIDGAEATIELKAERSIVTAMETRLTQAEIDIDGANAQISLKASKEETQALGKRITNAEVAIDGANAQIGLWAGELDEYGNRLDGAEILIDGLESQIKLKADKTTVTEMGERVTAAEVAIDGANAQIKLKASKEEVQGVSNRLSQAEVEIDGLNAEIKLVATDKSVQELAERVSMAEIRVDGFEAELDLMATQSTIDELVERVSNAEILIDGAMAEIYLKADQSTVTALGKRLTQAEVDIDGANAQIKLMATKAEVEDVDQRVSQAEIDIDAANAAISLKASTSSVTALTNRVSTAEADINAAESAINLRATKTEVQNLDKRLSQAEIDIDGANVQIALKASASSVTALGNRVTSAEIKIDGVESSIELLAEQIRLAGYVTMDEFEALEGQVSSLMGGLSSFTVVQAGAVNADSIVSTYLSAASIQFAGATVSQRSITMGGLTSAGKALTTGAIDLSHSHKVQVNSDGTITLGEVATSGGSFKIADTTYYKNGVSAAKDSVTLTNKGWQGGRVTVEASNGKSVTVSLPPFSVSGGDSFNSSHKTTVYFSTASVSGYLKSKEVDASSVYSSGVSSGKSAVTLSAAGWQGGSNVVSASNGKSVTVSLPPFSVSGGDSFNSSHKTTVYFSTASVSGYLKSKVVDATSVYNAGYTAGKASVDTQSYYDDGYAAGYQAAKDAVKVTAGISWSNPAQYYCMIRYWGKATIDGEEVGYASSSESRNIKGYC